MEKLSAQALCKLNKEQLTGKIICFPTDTVYGVGALFDDQKAIQKIYSMKKRDAGKPLVNLCSSVSQINQIITHIDEHALELMRKYWPGALTIILCEKEKSISFRMPNSEIALALLHRFSLLATTSVNESGEKELNTLADIESVFGHIIDYFVTDEATFSSVPSTVVKVCDGNIQILRQGQIKIN